MGQGPERIERRRNIPRRLVVTLVDRAIAELPRAQMTGSEVADLLLDLRRGIEVVERLPWKDDVEMTRLVRDAAPDRPARRWRLRFRRGTVSESTERGD